MTSATRIEAVHDWLSLVETSGLYLAPKVLGEAYPQSFDSIDTSERQRVRSAWEEWRDAVDEQDPQLSALHGQWIGLVLTELLEYRANLLKPVETGDEAWTHTLPDSGEDVRPGWLLGRTEGLPKLAVFVLPPDSPLDRASRQATSSLDLATAWCRAKGVRSALVTNGERWTLVDAPPGSVVGTVTWYARLWWLEPVTLRAFYTFLQARTMFGPPEKTFMDIVDRSADAKDDVTGTLGTQVARAVEVLVRALDRADRDRGGALLKGVTERALYEAGLTVMMRLVFVLSAEERGLLLLGEPVWDGYYAVSTLRAQLEETDERDGHGVLERRFDAWSRLLAVFRAVYAGVDHETLRLPALGGSLFDPDRFPFLEGRPAGTGWRDTAADPLPIDNRTVLLLLDALQRIKGQEGAQTLSYRALDVEQIGHVYEGLLERTVSRVPEITLGLEGTGQKKVPDVPLARLESAGLDGRARLVEVLAELTGRTTEAGKTTLARLLDRDVPDDLRRRLRRAGGHEELARRLLPFANVLRTDPWGEPLVYQEGAFAVTGGSDRSATGAHYTPKALTERIVATTLEPLAYIGPSEGRPRGEWRLKSAAELLDLKICDPAMGSGAFLVQTCRWLADRVVQSWLDAEEEGQAVTAEGEVLPELGGAEPLATDSEERLLQARRLVAERCLYGVDVNPVAVELAKLSVWLVTLAKNRPFGFLDHNLRHGNSLLGLRDLDQLVEMDLDPTPGSHRYVFAGGVREALTRAVALRGRLRAIPLRDIRDVEAMASLDREAREVLRRPELAADALVGESMRHATNKGDLEAARLSLVNEVDAMLKGEARGELAVTQRADRALSVDLPAGASRRTPFHWPLEFPEVFARDNGGFDAFVGNPPFLGGQKITGAMGTAFRDYLVKYVASGRKGSADLVAYFFLSCFGLLRNGGTAGLLAVNTIAEGDTREVGLTPLLNEGALVYEAHPNEPWPGAAAVVTSRIHMIRGEWQGVRSLSGEEVTFISSFLTDEDDKKALSLASNSGKSFQGSITLGMGFVLSEVVAQQLLEQNPASADVVYPYLTGDDLTSHPRQAASRWVINFWDWPLDRDATGYWVDADPRRQRLWLKEGSVPLDFPGKVAKDYVEVLRIVERDVKGERQRLNEEGKFALRTPLPEKWWIHAEKRPGLYHAIGRGKKFWTHPSGWTQNNVDFQAVLAFATQATKYPTFELCHSDQIFSNALGIISLSDHASYALLNSNFHTVWAWKYSSSLETRMRYTPTDCFETFPFPEILKADELFSLGERLKAARRRAHEVFDVGLTGIYNRLHDPSEIGPEISALRDVHVAVDERLKMLYGFGDVDLGHGFHDVGYLPAEDRTRFTISESARLELLRRLASLNKERYDSEQAAAQLPQKPKTKSPSKGKPIHTGSTLFDMSTPEPPRMSGAAQSAVLSVLQRSRRWFKKAEILRESGLSEADWKAVIDTLLAEGTVQRQGEKRGTEYKFQRQGER
ncbi:type IIL restriction-modification enzyme MmeI [Deinococcus sp. AJ005]|uniref:Eco57I restriction-modification methylase domain-containing protein n=1 Tax=Deinococcus sp. AJ005 TaxID=2652443 RepID=UPI00125CCCEF|nr:type IIL restriction-modification enzyme MmeI [Deinococcus sp. AJ005]QFP75031.1 ATP phosphoribosyltransferase regulatory subunit [Deinococcus sp. AJ005]